MKKVNFIWSLVRPKHCIKNLLVVVPAYFGKQLFGTGKCRSIIVGFVIFSLVTSAIYVFNDMADAEYDRRHPVKKNRPIANGQVSMKTAGRIMGLLLIVAISASYIEKQPVQARLCICFYISVNVLYSWKLKNEPVLDVIILAMGFVFRIIYGAFISEVSISGWLYLTIFSGAFYMGFGKRRNEKKILRGGGDFAREVLNIYTYEFLDKNMYTCLALTDVFYALWVLELNNRFAIWTVPLVMVITMKYSLNIERDADGDPVEVILGDKSIICLVVVYIMIISVCIYT